MALLKLGNQVKATKGNAEFLKDLTGVSELPKNAERFDDLLENSAQGYEDGTPEGRLLSGLLRLSKTEPDNLEEIPDPDADSAESIELNGVELMTGNGHLLVIFNNIIGKNFNNKDEHKNYLEMIATEFGVDKWEGVLTFKSCGVVVKHTF